MQGFTMLTLFNYKIEIKTTATAIKNKPKYPPMPEDNSCIAGTNQEVLPRR